MNTSHRFALLTVLFAVIAFAGCSGPNATELESTASVPPASNEEVPTEVVAAVNMNCPIMGKPVKDDGGRTDWNGQTIGFCCPGCIDAWNELSEEDKTSHLAKADEAAEESHAAHDHAGHDHDGHGHDSHGHDDHDHAGHDHDSHAPVGEKRDHDHE